MGEVSFPLEKLLKSPNDSIYTVTILAAKRAISLADGEAPLIERPGEKALDNSLREIAQGKICAKQKS